MANSNSIVQAEQIQNLLVIDPSAKGMSNVNVEDLSISVELEVYKRDENPIIFSNGEVTTGNKTNPEATRISFIDGVGEEDHLTTHYTELTTDFGKDNDVGSLGIESIDISFNTSYVPIVKIRFKDIRARLFEMGDESPYSFLFKMPYPIFYLTVKGYYGKPVKYALHLTKFNGQLDNDTGSFIITCDFIGYTYAFLADLLMGILKGIPYTKRGIDLMKPDFVSFDELTAVVSQLEKNITKFNKKNKPLRALSIFGDLIIKLNAIRDNLITSIASNSYNVVDNTNLVGAEFVSWGSHINIGPSSSLPSSDQDIYQREVLDFVEQYNNLNDKKGVPSYKLNKEDFLLDNDGVWINNYNTNDFIVPDGILNGIPKTFEEFQNSSLDKYPNYATTDDKELRAKYNNFIKIVDYKSKNISNFTYNFKENMTLFDIRFAIAKIDKLNLLITNDYKEAKKDVTETFIDGITEYLEKDGSVFDASIGSLFKILCSHVDLFVDVIKDLEKDIKEDVISGQRNVSEADKTNFSQYTDGTGLTEIPVNAFPEYIEKEIITDSDGKSNSALVEKWLGSAINPDIRKYKEVLFIDDLYDSMIKAAKKDSENLLNLVQLPKGWYPVNPLETKAFNSNNTNPWEVAENLTSGPILKLMHQRMSLFLGYSNDFSDTDKNYDREIINMAKIEANQLNESILDSGVKKQIIWQDANSSEWAKRVETTLGDGDESFGSMGKDFDLRLYYDDSFFSSNDEYVYRHGLETSNDVALLDSEQNISITQTEGNLTKGINTTNTPTLFGTSVVSNIDTPSTEIVENFIKIIPYDTYSQDYKYESWLGDSPSRDTKKTTRLTKNINEVNDFHSGLYKTHEFSTYIDDEIGFDNYNLSYEFYDKELKLNLLQNAKGVNKPFSFQSKFISNGKEFSLFGSEWYYAQTDISKALLFLHSIPFDGTNLESKGSTELMHGMLSDKNLKFFNERAGFVLVPDSWLLLLGGLLYRESLNNEMIMFSDANGSLVPNIDDIDLNKNDYLINNSISVGTFGSSSTYRYSNGAINFININVPREYTKIPDVILRLPESVKTILKSYFAAWVDNSEGWIKLKNVLELEFTPNGIIGDNYETVTENNTFEGNYDLKLEDGSDGSDALNIFLGSKKILMNSTYRIWKGETKRYKKIVIKEAHYNLYLKTFYNELSVLNGKVALDAKSKINRQLFNTDNVDDIKLSLYKNIKSVYNKWIVGVNPSVDPVILHDLYKSFNFLDRAHIDISNNFKISPTKFVEFLSTSSNMNFYSFIARILSENNFDFIPLPTFLDYSSAEKVKGVFEPQRFKDMAATNGPTFVCMYFGEQSNKLNVSKKDDRGDSFSIPTKYNKDGDLIISDFDDLPDDFKTGNRTIPYFLVNYADQNQSIFKNITLNQAEFTETNESLEIIESLSRRNRNNSLGQNLFDIYSNRAYSAEVEMLGNAQIQPFMFFQINNIPMFDGAYTIINTSHHIKANHMTTTFKGVRIRKVKTKMIDNETLYAHLLANLNEVDNDDANLGDIGTSNNANPREELTPEDKERITNSREDIPNDIKGTWANPLGNMNVTSDFGRRSIGFHNGMDFTAAIGTDVSTVDELIIRRVRWNPTAGGLYVDFRVKDRDIYIRYMHLSTLTHPAFAGITPVPNMDITQGGPIGTVIKKDVIFAKSGDSGEVPKHLHIDIRNTVGVTGGNQFKEPQYFFNMEGWTWNSNQSKLDDL